MSIKYGFSSVFNGIPYEYPHLVLLRVANTRGYCSGYIITYTSKDERNEALIDNGTWGYTLSDTIVPFELKHLFNLPKDANIKPKYLPEFKVFLKQLIEAS